MIEKVALTIDGVKIRASKRMSVLDIANEYGICIPHLCHCPDLTDLGACRLCIVEHHVGERVKVTTSCTLRVAEGMVIRTDTEKIQRFRKNIAELLVAQAPNSKAMQDMAVRCGVKEVRYPFRHDDCVLCGRCVRVCSDVWQAKAIGFVGRGQQRRVGFPFGKRPDFCKRCASCVELCPMTISPCEGPMKPGEEYLCGRCESQMTMAQDQPGQCVWCEVGVGFQCTRQLEAGRY